METGPLVLPRLNEGILTSLVALSPLLLTLRRTRSGLREGSGTNQPSPILQTVRLRPRAQWDTVHDKAVESLAAGGPHSHP